MAEKKKNPSTKSAEESRMSKPPVSKTARSAESPRVSVTRDAAAAVAQPTDAAHQLATFEAAMKLFHARKLQEGRDLFEAAAAGPERDIAQRARLHVAMCDRRLQKGSVNLQSAEDYYNYGVALLNTRNVPEARRHLERALELSPNADHVLYALGLARALGGDVNAAYESLKRAIELEPRNRIIARQDADFAHLANQPPFDTLIYPEKKSW